MTDNSYKDEIVKCMGGRAQYEMTVLQFCENLKDHEELRRFYGDMDINSLFLFQQETLDWAFVAYLSSEERNNAETRVKLRHHRLVNCAFGGALRCYLLVVC